MYKKNAKKVWNNNTHLSVDLKTQLRSDHYMKPGKSYTGILRRDIECDEFLYEDHFTFVETVPPTDGKRNPHVYVGQYITITRRDDGTLPGTRWPDRGRRVIRTELVTVTVVTVRFLRLTKSYKSYITY